MSDSLSDDPYFEDSFPEEERSYSTRIATRRFYVFLEVFMAMLINYLLNLGFFYLNELIPASDYKGLIIFFTSLISIIISVTLSLLFIKAVFYKNKMPLKEAEPPLKETTSLFTFKNFGMQLLFALLLLFLVYIPLDFLTYSLPGGLDFSWRSLVENDTQGISAYLNFTQFGSFILYGMLLHLMVGIREETFFRGFHTMRTEKYLNPGSSVVITSMYFAMSHFTYIFWSSQPVQDLLPAFVWAITAFVVGSASSAFILKKRLMWPIIIAHFLNNVISSTVVWLNRVHNVGIVDLAKMLYFPLIGVSIILVAIFFREVKTGIKSYFGVFKSYKTEIPEAKTRGKIIIADIVFGLIFWAVGMWFI
jgi:membrane protease YdiL (CAAX protease family)